MTDRNPAVTSRIMSAVRKTGTRPELALRRELFQRGLRYRVHTRVSGKPDLVFPRPRVAVFVDGDFWHGNNWRVRGLPDFDAQFARHRNPEFWKDKIQRNMARDRQVTATLEAEGWIVLRFWESDLRTCLSNAADRIEAVVRQRRQQIRAVE